MNKYEDEKYLINMVSADDIVRFGFSVGLNENSRVLDLCCGYGTMLKIWNEVFGISGIGVDREAMFIEMGRSRLPDCCIELICGDILKYTDNQKYDVVVCTELSTGLFCGFEQGIKYLERFLKPDGTLVFGRLFSEIKKPPQELIDFDGILPTLSEIYSEVRQCGYLTTSMVSGDVVSWERYIMRDSKLSLKKLRQNPDDTKWAEWTEKWHRMYYDFRRPYEGWGLFGIEKVNMFIKKDNLTIRNAKETDAEQLCVWWNDGKVMAHAGFPNGLNTCSEKIRESLLGDSNETHRRHIIEMNGEPIGEMNYRNIGDKTAEIGIKICDFAMQGKGYGTMLLTIFINELFTYYGYEKIILDTNLKNKRAQHVYEKKLGFHRIKIRENSWRDQMGELQSSVDYELKKEDWYAAKKNG